MQVMDHRSPLLAQSPSFNTYSSTRLAEIAARVTKEFANEQDPEDYSLSVHRIDENLPISDHDDANNDEEEEDDDEEFEFAVVREDPDTASPDEIFYNGQIRPIYPIFDRALLYAAASQEEEDSKPVKKSAAPLRLPLGKLMLEERDNDNQPSSSSSSEADELETIPSDTYCVWKPKSVEASPDRCKKSSSTGSGSSKRWKFRDFLPRSNSDGKDTYVFLSPSKSMKKRNNDKTEKAADRAAVQKADQLQQQPQQQLPKGMRHSISSIDYNSSQEKLAAKGKVKAKGVSAGDSTASAHEIHYVRNRNIKEGDRRRSYLPYKQDLVGLFSNVNGLSRNLHPF